MHAIGVTPAGRSPAMDLSLIIIAHARQTIPWDLLMLATLDADGAGYSTFALAESPAEYTVQRPQRRFLRLCGERDAENPMGLYGG